MNYQRQDRRLNAISLGDPPRHAMKTLHRAATRSSASFHQRNCQWRTGSVEHPGAFGATKTSKTYFFDPYKPAGHLFLGSVCDTYSSSENVLGGDRQGGGNELEIDVQLCYQQTERRNQ